MSTTFRERPTPLKDQDSRMRVEFLLGDLLEATTIQNGPKFRLCFLKMQRIWKFPSDFGRTLQAIEVRLKVLLSSSKVSWSYTWTLLVVLSLPAPRIWLEFFLSFFLLAFFFSLFFSPLISFSFFFWVKQPPSRCFETEANRGNELRRRREKSKGKGAPFFSWLEWKWHRTFRPKGVKRQEISFLKVPFTYIGISV